MKVATRRAVLATGGVFAAGTVAAVTMLRKPEGPVVHTLADAGPAPEAVAAGTIASLRRREPPEPPVEASFTDAEGVPHTLAAYRGKGLVVNLWATWCVPCVAEMPELQALARAVAAEGILVLPLSSDRGGAAVVRQFYARTGIDALPVLLDPKGGAARAWGARGLPTTLIIDRQGREQGRVEGGIDWASAASIKVLRALVG